MPFEQILAIGRGITNKKALPNFNLTGLRIDFAFV